MLGSGIFINTVVLTKQAGSLATLVYGIVGVLLLPLIIAIAQLLKYHQGCGTFYHFGSSISPYFGFLGSWSYFIAKLASCTLGIHVCISLLQEVIPILGAIPTLVFDSVIIILFVLLNMLNLAIGRTIQYGFLGLKLVPICFVLCTGLFLFSSKNFSSASLLWSGIPSSIPLVLYAFSGFEASCSLSESIENAEYNGPRAILISYALVVGIVMLYQLFFFGAVGMYLAQLPDYRQAFPAFLGRLLPHSGVVKNIALSVLHIGIASSSLGASYGIMYSNSWNLYTLAQHGHIIASKLFTQFNAHRIPYLCVLAEGMLAIVYLLLTQGQQIPLQQVSALGSVIAYTCSAFALLIITYRSLKTCKAIPLLSLASCLLLISSFIWSIMTKGVTSLLFLFLSMIAIGSVMFLWKSRTKNA